MGQTWSIRGVIMLSRARNPQIWIKLCTWEKNPFLSFQKSVFWRPKDFHNVSQVTEVIKNGSQEISAGPKTVSEIIFVHSITLYGAPTQKIRFPSSETLHGTRTMMVYKPKAINIREHWKSHNRLVRDELVLNALSNHLSFWEKINQNCSCELPSGLAAGA